VGAVVALGYVAAVDDPARFRRSRSVGVHFGMTPRRYQSGEVDRGGAISRMGDEMMRTLLYEAASSLMGRVQRFSALKAWALRLAVRRGVKRARVALARKLAVILHRMWVDGTEFRWTRAYAARPGRTPEPAPEVPSRGRGGGRCRIGRRATGREHGRVRQQDEPSTSERIMAAAAADPEQKHDPRGETH
jgi:hypothetical protein